MQTHLSPMSRGRNAHLQQISTVHVGSTSVRRLESRAQIPAICKRELASHSGKSGHVEGQRRRCCGGAIAQSSCTRGAELDHDGAWLYCRYDLPHSPLAPLRHVSCAQEIRLPTHVRNRKCASSALNRRRRCCPWQGGGLVDLKIMTRRAE